MSILPNKPTKSKPPFYFYEGKGWKIETKIKVDGKFVKLSKCWFRTLQEAAAALPAAAEERAKKITKGPKQVVTWSDFTERYIAYRRTQVKGSSLTLDKTRIRYFFDPLFIDKKVGDCFKRESARMVQEKAVAEKSSRVHRNKTLHMYLAMLEFAFDHEYLDDDADFRKAKSEISKIAVSEEEAVKKYDKHILTSSEQEALLSVIVDEKDKLLTYLLLETGMRVSEALTLKAEDFDFDEGTVHVHATVSRDEFGTRRIYNRTKTPLGQRHIPLREEAQRIVASYIAAFGIKADGFLFPSESTVSGVMDYFAYKNRLSSYSRKAGIPHISPHCLRHTVATRLSETCHSDAERQARAYIMGHSVLVDEQTYTAHNQLTTAKRLIN